MLSLQVVFTKIRENEKNGIRISIDIGWYDIIRTDIFGPVETG